MIPGIDPTTSALLQTGLEHYVLIGGSVFDARAGALLQNRAVLIERNLIQAVCDPGNLDSEIVKIDISGKTVLPGLIDVHVHSEDWHAPLYLAKGITAVRDTGCELETVLRRREKWNASHQAPRLVCTGPLLDNLGNTWPATTRTVQNPLEARRWVDYLVDRGVDQIKAYAFLDWPCFQAILEQAHRRGKFVLAHLGKHVNARQAIEAGLDALEHLSGIAEALWWERNQQGQQWEFFKLWASIDLERANRMIDLIQGEAPGLQLPAWSGCAWLPPGTAATRNTHRWHTFRACCAITGKPSPQKTSRCSAPPRTCPDLAAWIVASKWRAWRSSSPSSFAGMPGS